MAKQVVKESAGRVPRLSENYLSFEGSGQRKREVLQ